MYPVSEHPLDQYDRNTWQSLGVMLFDEAIGVYSKCSNDHILKHRFLANDE